MSGTKPPAPIELDRCPSCGEPCTAVKARSFNDITFLLVGAFMQEKTHFGCEACLRRELKRHLLKNLLTANLLWPFLTLPAWLWARRKLDTPGHDAAWTNAVRAAQDAAQCQLQDQAAFEAARQASAESDVTALSRHATGERYVPRNGHFGLGSQLLFLLWAFLGVPVLACLYTLACHHCIDPRINVVLAVLAPLLHGLFLRWLAQKTDCCSPWGLRAFALALGLESLYISWVFWGWLDSQHEYIFYGPDILWAMVKYYIQNGCWQYDGKTIGPVMLSILWGAEALGLVFTPLVCVWNAIRDRPFCTECGTVLKRTLALPPLAPPEDQQFFAELKAGHLEALEKFRPAEGPNAFTVTVLSCPHCRGDYLFTFRRTIQAPVPGYAFRRDDHAYLPPVWCTADSLRHLQLPAGDECAPSPSQCISR